MGKTGPKGKVKGDVSTTAKGKGDDYTMDKGSYKGKNSAEEMKDLGLGGLQGFRGPMGCDRRTPFLVVKIATPMCFNTIFSQMFFSFYLLCLAITLPGA